MKSYRLLLVAVIAFCVMIISCKLDDPVEPGDTGYIATIDPTITPETVLGTSSIGITVNNSNLSGTWKVTTTTKQFYDQNNVIVAASVMNNLFTSIALSDITKTAQYEGLYAATSNQTYTLAGNGDILYIQLSADPFSRSVNGRIQVANLTAKSMTWLAIDPLIVSAGGQLLRNAYLITFTK